MEEERYAPAVTELAARIDGGVIRWDKDEFPDISPRQRRRDFPVRSAGIATAGPTSLPCAKDRLNRV